MKNYFNPYNLLIISIFFLVSYCSENPEATKGVSEKADSLQEALPDSLKNLKMVQMNLLVPGMRSALMKMESLK